MFLIKLIEFTRVDQSHALCNPYKSVPLFLALSFFFLVLTLEKDFKKEIS